MADKLIDKGLASAVTIVPIGIGGVPISAWAEGGRHHALLLKTLDNLRKKDAFRSRGFNAPIIIAQASYHPGCLYEGNGCSEEIREAQAELARRYDDIFLGPDTDQLNKLCHRHDGIHFSYLGQDIHANMWVEAIQNLPHPN